MWTTLYLAASVLVITFAGTPENLKAGRDRNRKSYKIVCYWNTRSVYRQGYGKFEVDQIDPSLCTHIIYAFAGLDSDGRITSINKNLDLEENRGKGNIKKFMNLRKANPDVTLMVAVGGEDQGSARYSEMAGDQTKRKGFVDSCVQFLNTHGFDGLDVHWQFPANNGGKPEDKQNFATLIQELRKELDKYGFVLSAAVSGLKDVIDKAYDIPKISKYLRFINVMAYEYHDSSESVIGYHSLLHPFPEEVDEQRELNADFAINYLIGLGAPREKLVLGIPTYAKTYTLLYPELYDAAGAPATGPGEGGPYTKIPGIIAYFEICEAVYKNSREYDWRIRGGGDEYGQDYATKGKQWVGYDGRGSFFYKAIYVRDMKLGGAMVWSIDTDDFHDDCLGKYRNLHTLMDMMDGKY